MTIGISLQPSFYNNILSDSVDPRAELPSLGRCLSQGAAVGALLGFTWPVHAMFSDPENGYNFLLATWLPLFLFAGMAFGVIEGVLIWAVSYLTGHRLHAVIRVVLAVVILALLLLLIFYIYFEPLPPNLPLVRTYVFTFGGYVAYGVAFGLAIGSRFRPVDELIRGATPPRRPAMSGITGLLLRLFVLFALMEEIMFFIWVLQRDFQPRDFGFAIVGLVHFAVATALLFVRMPFWLLLPLALIINLPVAAFYTDVLIEADVGARVVTLNYLGLWGAFLLCRFSLPRWFMRKEPR